MNSFFTKYCLLPVLLLIGFINFSEAKSPVSFDPVPVIPEFRNDISFAEIDSNSFPEEIFIRNSNSVLQAVKDSSEVDKAHTLLDAVVAADRFINKLDSLYCIDLPVGIVQRDGNDAEKYAIIISEIKVIQGKSFLTAYMAFTVPGSNKRIAFKGVDIPFSFSGGIQGEATLELVADFDIDVTKEMTMVLKGKGLSSVTFDCFGFKKMTITADLLFDQNIFIPENYDGTLREGEQLKTTIQTSFTDWNNMLVGISLDPFQIKGMKGLGFKITNAIFDMSDYQNPVGINFGTAYNDYFIDNQMDLWQGVFINEVEVRMPPEFHKNRTITDSTGGRLSFYGSKLMIDDLGFSGSLGIKELMTLEEGDLGGWQFSVEDFSVQFSASQLVGGAFVGQIRIPEFEQNSIFDYTAIIGVDNSYAFSVGITDSVELEIWSADLRIDPNSSINIDIVDGEFLPSLLLNGQLTLNSSIDTVDNNSKKLSIANIPFQGMRIQTVEPYFSVSYISFGTEQNSFSDFPVQITKIGFKSEQDRAGINMGLMVNFTGEGDGGFCGEGDFTVWGIRENNEWKYDGVEVDKIIVDISKPNAFELYGEILFIKGDSTYGNGFKGVLDAKFASFGMQATALFGNVNGLRYWYADALVTLPAGIPAGPISLYGFGGGAFYHMRQTGISKSGGKEIGASTSGIIYSPNENSGLGLKASVKFGLSGNQDAFNGDVEFGISFTTSGGLDQISFIGNAYVATVDFGVSSSELMENAKTLVGRGDNEEVKLPAKAEDSQIYGNINMLFDFPNKSFHAVFNIYVNIAEGIVTGIGPQGLAGWGVVHFDPNDWYVHLGTPDKPNGISILDAVETTNYFMAGKSIPELPSPPEQVILGLTQNGEKYSDSNTSSNLGDGSGFILGAGFSVETGEKTFLMFYGRFGCGIGFDILMKKYTGVSCEGRGDPGVNGWYAQGQAYAWIAAAVGVKVDLPFYSGRYAIFEMDVAALLQAKGPNPFWMKGNVAGSYNILNGLVSGNCDFEFEIGEQCNMVGGSPFGGAPVIAEITPAESETDVSVFTTPQVVFNMPVDKIIQFQDENNNTKSYKIKLNSFILKKADGTEIKGEYKWNSKNDVLAIKTRDVLPGETELEVFAEISFQEYRYGNWYDIKENGEITVENKSVKFQTGEEPDYIPQDNVLYSYPEYQQFNYYKNEANQNYVKLDFGQPKLFPNDGQWLHQANLTPVLGGQTITTNVSYDEENTQVNFALSSNLVNNTVYNVEFVNVPANTASNIDENIDQITEDIETGADDNTSNMQLHTQEAEGTRTELQEKVIYNNSFRTSLYNTFDDKIASLNKSDGISWELYPLVHSLTVNIRGERFDSYEVENLASGKLISCEPLINETLWYTTYIKPLFDINSSTLSSIGATAFIPSSLTSYYFQPYGTRRLTDDEISTGYAPETDATSGMKYYMAKYACEYMSEVKGKIANAYVNRPIVDSQLQRLFNAKFIPLKYGSYPVSVKYTLPGQSSPSSTIKHVIEYVD